MSEIRYPENPDTPLASGPFAAAPAASSEARGARSRARKERDAEPDDSPWQSAVVRVSTAIAVWLGY